ncbi:GAF domain-containing sensor histidine kinase [Paenibacillus soyae]|uniref:Oxygen sensor histidine kinase NreB n=1 Tax=Paenibacillus soyae TaxID=2969249 RepID=A0A9X2MX51_9BACL|nr:GAF domain-containing sensor histidine kinase [Paenibacillus soyae]MCR2805197.1 GAF domain-containing sensor histidine kinase [Paenibacillus soyae]
MNNISHIQELTTMRTIAETLNQSNCMTTMLDAVLEKLLEVTGLHFGWIFLMDEHDEFALAADRNLPPALLHDDRSLVRCGSCWCVDKYFENRLKDAVNIMSCRRLSQAKAEGLRDTCGFTHHATVPLRIGGRKFGLLNVGSAGKDHFQDEELALLQAVSFQIGVAVERMRLHQAEQRRAEQFAKLSVFSRQLHQAVSTGIAQVQLAEKAASLLAEHFDWPAAVLLERAGGQYRVQAMHVEGEPVRTVVKLSQQAVRALNSISKTTRSEELQASELAPHLPGWSTTSSRATAVWAAPVIPYVGQSERLLLVSSSQPAFLARVESEVLEAAADHIAAAMDHARLEENRRELVRVEERNRLARDLHDSVSQMLFSLSMSAKGAEAMLNEQEWEAARETLREITGVSKDALKEMRSLIMQMRPANLDGGVATALREYGRRLGIDVKLKCNGCMRQLPSAIEETLWRIGQETLNNVAKHASTDQVDMALYVHGSDLVYVAKDNGEGADLEEAASSGGSLGLSIMRERVEAAGGRLKLTSSPGQGMLIEASFPLSPADIGGITVEDDDTNFDS